MILTKRTETGKLLDISGAHSQYLALALNREYNIPIVLWLDYDEVRQKERLVHAFNIIGEQILIDNNGVFKDISQRQGMYPHTHVNLEVYKEEDEIKEKLTQLGVEHTDTEIKKVVREELREKWIRMDLNINETRVPIILWQETPREIFFLRLGNKDRISKLITKVPKETFKAAQKLQIGVVPRKQYKGLSHGVITRRL